MSLAFGFALPHWQAISGGFSPASLFAGGTAGAWYDPSDLTTLFTTSAGTTQCAMPGQGSAVSVGLMLDKSQGLVLGPELVSGNWANGTSFPFDTFTASGTGFTGNKTAFGISQAVLPAGASITSGALYRVELRITFADDDEITVNFQTSSGGGGVASSSSFSFGNISSTTTIVGYVRGTSTGTAYLQMSQQGTNRTLTVASVSVRALPGNHAIAFNNTTARPELRARVNLLTYSEEFGNAAWTKDGVTAVNTTATTDPLGGTTADILTATTTTAYTYQAVTVSTVAVTFSCYVKAATASVFWLYYFSGAIEGTAYFQTDLTTQAVAGSSQTPSNLTITSIGNGWFRISAQWSAAAGSRNFGVGICDAKGSLAVTNGRTGYVWGAQLTATNEFPANTYQRIADQYTYDTSGFPLYLRFDGIDDSMYTPANLNLSGTDKVSVFAGVRKLSDAATGVVAEISTNSGANNGTFYLAAPDDAANLLRWVSRGTSSASASTGTSSVYAAPLSSVLTGVGDISGDSSILRVNGTQAVTSSTDQGSGNFGSYPLFIGARNNNSFRLNGHLYSLAVVGSAVSAGNIAAMESWVAGRTGIAI